jgi:hypothetical protein
MAGGVEWAAQPARSGQTLVKRQPSQGSGGPSKSPGRIGGLRSSNDLAMFLSSRFDADNSGTISRDELRTMVVILFLSSRRQVWTRRRAAESSRMECTRNLAQVEESNPISD